VNKLLNYVMFILVITLHFGPSISVVKYVTRRHNRLKMYKNIEMCIYDPFGPIR
jgi:hypothetical protein